MPKLFPKNPWLKAAFLTALGGILVAGALRAANPNETPERFDDISVVQLPPEPEELHRVEVRATRQATDTARAPTFTPYTVQPDIKNRSEIARSLEREYPPLLRDAGIGGTVQIWFFIDGTGEVQRLQVKESSGHRALDDAALRGASAVSFTPALNRDKPVPVWIALPITFTTAGPSVPEARPEDTPLGAFKHFVAVTFEYLGDWLEKLLGREASVEKAEPELEAEAVLPVVLPPDPPARRADVSAAPTFTPYTVQPDIVNRSEIARALERAYPPLLRDAGIWGTAQVWFFIDKTGEVQKTQLNKSTGHQALDDAALEVAETIRFTPALNREKRVPVWISLPITFSVR